MIFRACTAAVLLLASRPATAACPQLSGDYRVASADGVAMSEALDAMGIGNVARRRSELRLRGPDARGLAVWVKEPGSRKDFAVQPQVTLREGSSFRCSNGRIVFPPVASTSRSTESAHLEGESTVSLTGGGLSGLVVHIEFKGRQRSTLWSYDSARISIPKFGTGRTLREALRWPEVSQSPPEPEPAIAKPSTQPEEPQDVRAVRQRLNDAKVLGAMTLNVLKSNDPGVLAILTATRSEHVIEMEDRLRDAAIPYEVKKPPVWSANVFQMELLFWPPGVRVDRPWRPSALRVEHELSRLRRGGFEVRRVEATAEGYVATLDVAAAESTTDLVAGLKRDTKMFAEIQPIDESPRADTPKWRVARVRLRMP